ncbi:MAG: DEAD/DEAH box helicase, partial [Acidobacteria bacterium]|nr:DEAD/DEAH box helicase [Acidobacteriota bacterium]
KTEEIKTAFDQLQLDLNLEINQAMTATRRKLLENFDDEVREKLRVQDEASRAVLTRFEHLLMRLTRHELNEHAEFLDDSSFRLRASPFGGEIPLGLYELPRRSGEALTYRLNHPLAEAVIAHAKSRELPPVEIQFNYSGHKGKISVLEPLRRQSGYLSLSLFTVESLEQAEDHLILAAITDAGQPLDEEAAHRLFSLPGQLKTSLLPLGEGKGEGDSIPLKTITQQRQESIQRTISERNGHFFEAEADKLDGWAEDIKLGLEREIKELDRQIREVRREATSALTLEEKLAGQKKMRALEAQRSEKRRSLFDAQDKVDKQRDELIVQIEGKLQQKSERHELFRVRWSLR